MKVRMILMKNSIFRRVLSTAVAGFLAISSTSFVAKDLSTNAAKVLQTGPSHTQETGWYNDYHHEIWQADTPNSSTMTLADEGGGFSTSWKCGPNGSRGNFLARRGLFWDAITRITGRITETSLVSSTVTGQQAVPETPVSVYMAGQRIRSLSSTSSRTGKTGFPHQEVQSR